MRRFNDLFGDMPTLPPTFDKRDDDILAALVSGAPLPSDAPVEARLVADLFTALAAPGSPAETAGLEAARQAFRAEHPGAHRPPGYGVAPHRVRWPGASRRPSRSRGSGRLIAASVLGVLGLGGFAGAAFAGVLPDAMQAVAHRLVGAPSPEHSPPASSHAPTTRHAPPPAASTRPSQATGPGAPGPAAAGLCTAFDLSRHETAAQRASYEHSQGYARLVAAAGGEANVGVYCAGVTSPSTDAPGATHAAGKPSTLPSSGSSHGGPSETGRPSAVPSHSAHAKPSPSQSSGAPSSPQPAASSVPGHPTHTRTPPPGAHTSPAKGAGSTRSPR